MKRACTLCKQEFLHRRVDILHEHLNLCFDCQKALVKVYQMWTVEWGKN